MLPETRFLIQHLTALEVGAIADFASLSEAARVDVLQRRHILSNAVAIVARDHGVMLESVAGIGYKRVESESIPISVAIRRTNKILGQTKRWRNEVHYSGMASTPDGARSLSQCNFAEFAVRADTQKTIALHSRHDQPIDFDGVGRRMLNLFED